MILNKEKKTKKLFSCGHWIDVSLLYTAGFYTEILQRAFAVVLIKYKLTSEYQRYIINNNNNKRRKKEDVPLVELLYLVFTHMPGESYPRRLGSFLLCLCDVFRVLINSCVLILLKTCFVQQIEVIKQKREIKDFVLKCSLDICHVYMYVKF